MKMEIKNVFTRLTVNEWQTKVKNPEQTKCERFCETSIFDMSKAIFMKTTDLKRLLLNIDYVVK